MQDNIKYGLIVFGIIFLLLVLTKLPGYSANHGEVITVDQLKLIGDEAKRMFYISKQDQNPLLSVLHATMALSKLNILMKLGPLHRISQKLDTDINILKSDIISYQRQKIQEINALCPSLSLSDDSEIDWFV
jgi:hypothetical protein